MKSNALAVAVATASLGFSALSLAQDRQRQGGREDGSRMTYRAGPQDMQRVDQRAERRDDRWDHRNSHRPDFRGPDLRTYYDYDQWPYYNARGPQFRRGGYIPREFRNRQYQVVDYYTYRLSAPPRDHQWVQVGADYVLIAIATGLIASIVLSN